MIRRWTPAFAATTALVLLATSGAMEPSTAGGTVPGERATTYLLPEALAVRGGTSATRGDPTADPAVVQAADDGSGTPAARSSVTTATGRQDASVVALPASQQMLLARHAGEVPHYVHSGPVQGFGMMDHPVADRFALSSVFGWRVNPTDIGPALQFHIGQDYAVPCGTPVRAAADGTVTFAGPRGTAGLRVDVGHDGGLATAYRHNSVLLVAPGDSVSRGDVLALSGTTGNSTGCHVHFETTLDGQYVDPVLMLPANPGQPRSLSATDLERIRAAAQRTARETAAAPTITAARTSPAEDEAADRPGDATADRQRAARSAGTPDREETPRTPDRSPAEKPTKTTKTEEPPQAEKTEKTEKTEQPEQDRPEQDRPDPPAQPAQSVPSPSETTTPGLTVPVDEESDHTPVQTDPSGPTPTAPEPTPAETEPTELESPEPTPTEPEPTAPEEPEPSASPSGEPAETEPTDPEATAPESTEPTPTDPEPTAPEEPEPSASPSGQPAETEPTEPEPTDPEATAPESTEPTPTEPEATAPESTEPTPTEPEATAPEEPEPSASPSGEPAETDEEPTPVPTMEGGHATEDTPEIAAPATLTEAQASQWCLRIEDGQEPSITDETVLTELVAVLDQDGDPEWVDGDLLATVGPTAAWLESLPPCSDSDFLAAAFAARSTDGSRHD